MLIVTFDTNMIAQQNELNQAEEIYLESVQEFYEKVLEDDSTNYDALTNLGVISQQMGDLEKSLLYFQKAARFHP